MFIGAVMGFVIGLLQGDVFDGLGFGLLIGLALGAAFNRRDQLMQLSSKAGRSCAGNGRPLFWGRTRVVAPG